MKIAILSLVAFCSVAVPAQADYKAAFVASGSGTAPVVIESGSVRITDSDVGNQNYDLSTCYLARSMSQKTIVLERYRLDIYSALDGKLASRNVDLKHTIAPMTEDLPFGPPNSECLSITNLWGESVEKVVMTPIAVQYDDGTIWKLKTKTP